MNDHPMNVHRMNEADADLEAALLDLGGALAPTDAPDLARMVRVRVESMGVPSRARPRWIDRLLGTPGRPARRGLILALAALLALAGIAAAIGFGLPGLRIVFLGPSQTTSPPPSTSPSGSGAIASQAPNPSATVEPTSWALGSLGLGDPVDRAGVDAAAGYPVLLPTVPELGQPVAIYVRGTPPNTAVSAAYAATPTIPAPPGAPNADGTPVAILVMEFPGQSDFGFLKKMLPPGTTIEPVKVAGHDGFWIAGQPHELLYIRPDGTPDNEQVRLVGNVLAWNDGQLTIRIEGAPDLATALRIAGSMR
jgi:hypothetical protein